MNFQRLFESAKRIIAGGGGYETIMQSLCDFLCREVHYYDWVGFYLVKNGKQELILGPYTGEATEHGRIEFGQGICGQAAAKKATLLVQDVRREGNYLACSAKVRSEIVVPILKSGEIRGEIDIDSHTLNAFSAADQIFLERLAKEIAPLLP